MPRYDFECKACGEIEEFTLLVSEMTTTKDLPCDSCSREKPVPHRHVMHTPSIGSVQGAGGSPSR